MLRLKWKTEKLTVTGYYAFRTLTTRRNTGKCHVVLLTDVANSSNQMCANNRCFSVCVAICYRPMIIIAYWMGSASP